MPQNAAKYRKIPQNAVKCRKMPQNTAKFVKCRKMPQNTAKCRKMPQNTAKCREILLEFLNTVCVVDASKKNEGNELFCVVAYFSLKKRRPFSFFFT